MRLAKEAAEARLAQAATDAAHRNMEREEIQVLKRPKGEAGDKKKGFELRKAMKLDGDENKELYDVILVYTCLVLTPQLMLMRM
jgi:hypothetical protein